MPHMVATFADTNRVHIWDTLPFLNALDAPAPGKLPHKPEVCGNALSLSLFHFHFLFLSPSNFTPVVWVWV